MTSHPLPLDAAALALQAERDALLAHVEALREAGDRLRVSVSGGQPHSEWVAACERFIAAHASTPAQSLAALRASVRAEALREAAERCVYPFFPDRAEPTGSDSSRTRDKFYWRKQAGECCAKAIRALAAQEGASDATP